MNKLTLNEIVGYLPFKLQVLESYNNRIGVLHSINVNGKVSVLHKVIWDFEIEEIKPILNRIEDFSLEELDKWIHIQETNQDNLQFSIQANEFMYSNHVDIHNLIDRGLAVDKKTIQP